MIHLLLILSVGFQLCLAQRLPQFAGIGYNLFTGNPLANTIDPGFQRSIFDFTYSNSSTTDDGLFQVPLNLQSRSIYSCSLSSKTSEYSSAEAYQSDLKVRVGLSAGDRTGSFSFSANAEFKAFVDTTSNQDTVYTVTGAECQLYRIELPVYGNRLSLTAEFMDAVTGLLANPNDWTAFIEYFGTHYVTSAVLGGHAHLEHKFSREKFYEMKKQDININIAAHAQFSDFVGDVNGDFSYYQNHVSAFQQSFSEQAEIYIGGAPMNGGNWMDWLNQVKLSPAPISVKLKPITDLFTTYYFPSLTKEKLDLLKNGFNSVLNYYCTKVGCVKSRIKSCRAGWYWSDAIQACYRIAPDGGHSAGVQYCRNVGGRSFEPITAADFNFMKTFAVNNKLNIYTNAKASVPKMFSWLNGTRLDNSLWCPSDEFHKTIYVDENNVPILAGCAIVNYGSNCLSEIPCFYTVKTLCAYTPNSKCPIGWYWADDINKCYRLHNDILEKNSSSALCKELGGKLFEIRSNEDYNFLKELPSNNGSLVLGGKSLGPQTYAWTSGLLIDPSFWCQGQPTNIDVTEKCVYYTQYEQCLFNLACTFRALPICEC